jgi:hypothetical protein
MTPSLIPNASEDGRAGDTQQSSDMVERVARLRAASAAISNADKVFVANKDGLFVNIDLVNELQLALVAYLEASHHAELVDASCQLLSSLDGGTAIGIAEAKARLRDVLTEIDTIDCPACGGSGFSGHGTGYGDVCGQCGGTKRVAKIGGEA